MNYKSRILVVALLALVLACAENPFTGKSTMALVPNSQIFPTAFQQYSQFLSENKVWLTDYVPIKYFSKEKQSTITIGSRINMKDIWNCNKKPEECPYRWDYRGRIKENCPFPYEYEQKEAYIFNFKQ